MKPIHKWLIAASLFTIAGIGIAIVTPGDCPSLPFTLAMMASMFCSGAGSQCKEFTR